MNSYELSDDELLLLDGKVNEKVQKEIDFIKNSKVLHPHKIIGEKLAQSLNLGTFQWEYKSIRWCDLCGKKGGYAKYPRSGKGHRKGDLNYSKPLYMGGIHINYGFVTVQGIGTCCRECNDKDKIVETIIDIILDRELPIELLRDARTKFKKDDLRICFNCKERIYESEMGRSSCLMGSGTYPGVCPKCKAESMLFGKTHETTSEFRMLRLISTNY